MGQSDKQERSCKGGEAKVAERKAWTSPVLRCVGDITTLVSGGGKSASVLDMDPQATTKSGGG